jgi:hypothetical protein
MPGAQLPDKDGATRLEGFQNNFDFGGGFDTLPIWHMPGR